VIYEYRQRFLHCKLALCDDWASVGLSNFDRWGALWNLDANQEIASPVFAAQVEATFGQICQESAVLRHPRDVEHRWSVYFWWHVARDSCLEHTRGLSLEPLTIITRPCRVPIRVARPFRQPFSPLRIADTAPVG
jgi:phosphatidylserine/phosphatidylglycerophosphate/cardiolipin synthase-like enzyme